MHRTNKHQPSKQLISHDQKSNHYNYKHTFSVEIVPVCKDDLVMLPSRLAAEHGFGASQLGVLPDDELYWPPWNPWGISQLYRSPRCLMPESLGVHLWETKMYQSLLGKLTAEIVNKRDTCFARMASAVLDGSSMCAVS